MNGTQSIRPSLWYAALAIPFLLAGIGVMAFILITGIVRVRKSMVFADVPGEVDLNLKRNLLYTIFLEQTSGGTSDPGSMRATPSEVSCEVHALPYGDLVPLRKPSGSTTYNYGATSGVSFLEFSVPRDGTYMLVCLLTRESSGPKLRAAVGSGAAAAIGLDVLKGIVALFAGCAIALLIFVRVLMLRDQSKREIRALGLKPL